MQGGDRAADLKLLLTPQFDLRRKLAAAMRERLEVGDDAGEIARLDLRAAEVLNDLLHDLKGVLSEAIRRGVHPGLLDAAYADRFPGTEGLDPGFAFGPMEPTGDLERILAAWEASADGGSAPAQYLLGEYLFLRPLEQADVDEGIARLQTAADLGFGPACVSIALEKLEGDSVPRDESGAAAELRKAAAAGLSEAWWQLGNLHSVGVGVEPDDAEALRCLTNAAEAGSAEAQLELGRGFAVGTASTKMDHAAARMWLERAAAQHRQIATEWLEQYGDLEPEQYRRTAWYEAWTPEDLPSAARAGCIGLAVSVGLLGLLVLGAVKGNSLGLFLLVLFLAILVHEGGHYLAARLVGIPIMLVSLGLGPLVRCFNLRRGRLPMRVDLRLLPLMGSVRPYTVPRGVWDHWRAVAEAGRRGQDAPPLPDFDEDEEPEPAFFHVSRPRRLVFLAGGLAMNLFFAILCLWIYEHASDQARLRTVPVVGYVPSGSVADQAGLEEGDRILTVNGEPIGGFFDAADVLVPEESGDPGTAKVIRVEVLRGTERLTLSWPGGLDPPDENALDSYGLNPPLTWKVRNCRSELGRTVISGSEIVEFEFDGSMVAVTDSGAREAFRAAYRTASGPVKLRILKNGRTLSASAGPWRPREDDEGRPPFEFERRREERPARSLVQIAGRTIEFGWRMVITLPRTIVRSITEPATEEEKGWLAAAVKRDPWAGVRIFALINAFLLFLNLIPIAPLDGFHLLVGIVEIVARRPVPKAGVAIAMRAGMAVLILWLLLNVFLILRDLAGTIF